MGRKKAKKRRPRPDKAKKVDKAVEPAGDLLPAIGLTLLAFVHRLFFLYSNAEDRNWPFTVFYQGDARTFFLHARALLSGQMYDNGIPFHPPGFPAFLAGLHTILGFGEASAEVSHLTVKTSLALVSSVAVGLLYLPLWLSLVAAGTSLAVSGLNTSPRLRFFGLLAAGLHIVGLLVVEGLGADDKRNYKVTANTLDGTTLNPDDTVRLEVLKD